MVFLWLEAQRKGMVIKMKHRITVRYIYRKDRSLALTAYLHRSITEALDAEGIHTACEVNVLITNDQGIRAINLAARKIDSATDVLSFPMFSYSPGAFPADVSADIDTQTGLLPIGDIVISLECARDQAKRFGHSTRREIGYLTVHSVLHLLGYDHLDEGEMKVQMRRREEYIMQKMNLRRTK